MREAIYERSQALWLLVLLTPLVPLTVGLSMLGRGDRAAAWTALGVLAVHAGLLLCLGRFTVAVGEGHVEWGFGWLGRPRWRLPLADIAEVEVARSTALEGWGIRSTREGMLYNARGSGAVRLKLRDGRSLRLGSDEPERLAGFIAARLQRPR